MENHEVGLQSPKAIEWLSFLDRASQLALSFPGRQKILDLADGSAWAPSIESAALRQQETIEASQLLTKNELWGSLHDLESPATLLERLGKRALLDAPEWSQIRRWLGAIQAFRQAVLPPDPLTLSIFRSMTSSLPDVDPALHRLDQILTPEGELSENASPELARIGAELRGLKREISNRMDLLARDYHQKGVLQDQFSDVRDGRFVLPVKLSAQHEVPGLLHEASASRQTVFIEPRQITELNNRLRERQNDWIQEVHRILTELTRDLAPQAPEWTRASEHLIYWDAVHARAAVARHYEGLPLECGGDSFDLQGTAHPLLWWTLPLEQIQRNSIYLESSKRALLITGPNTGGKTVLLKTLGLAALFARTGFFFPQDQPGRVPFFTQVVADLGDSQSIESHLSSFSSHLRAFQNILAQAGPSTLVLLDELNSATDPEEGAALSRALLETLLERGAWLVTTTHDPVLKSLGQKDSRILTAAMAFDEAAQTPTYRLELGVPGRSRAIETAERLGIPAGVLERAKGYLSTQHREWENWVGELERQVRDARLARQHAEEKLAEIEQKSLRLSEQLSTLQDELRQVTRQKIRQILEQTQETVRNRLQALEQEPSRKRIETSRNELVREVEQSAERITQEIEESFGAELKKSGAELRPVRPQPQVTLQPGATVRVSKWKTTGKVLEVLSGGMVRVAMGTLQVTLKPSEFELTGLPVSSQPRPQKVTVKWESHSDGSDGESSPRLDLRGLRLDEAILRAERYLEKVFTSGRYTQVTLVHGLGTGALREGIRKLLSELPFITDYRDGGPGMGGTGATVVDLRI